MSRKPMLALLELNQKIGTPANDGLRVYPISGS